MVEISIIVPVYNVKEYLKKCVDSLIAQTFKDIEIILVDDGSTDGSSEICDELLKEDERIRVIHKENGGLSDARNTGIDAARGKYIGFIDSDDYVDEHMYEILYRNLKKENADISMCGMYHCYANKTTVKAKEGYQVMDGEEAIRMCLDSRKIGATAVNRLYSVELAKKVRFPYGKRSEDVFILVELFSRVEKVVLDLTPLYYYVHREGTISTSAYQKGDLNVIEGYEKNKKLIEEKYPSLLEQVEFRCYWARFYVLDKMLLANNFSDYATKREIEKYLKENYRNIMKNAFVGRARKLALTGLMLHESLYKLCLKQQRKRVKRI